MIFPIEEHNNIMILHCDLGAVTCPRLSISDFFNFFMAKISPVLLARHNLTCNCSFMVRSQTIKDVTYSNSYLFFMHGKDKGDAWFQEKLRENVRERK